MIASKIATVKDGDATQPTEVVAEYNRATETLAAACGLQTTNKGGRFVQGKLCHTYLANNRADALAFAELLIV